MKKILCIIRVSTVAQEMESQRNDMIKWLTSMGYTNDEIEVKEYEGASARSLNAKYLTMLEDIKRITTTTTIKSVAVWHINRLGRVESKLMEMKEFFVANKVQLYVKQSNVTLLDENGNLTTGGSLVFSMFAAMVAEDTKEMMEKFARGKSQRRADGKTDGAMLPLGYYVEKETKLVRVDEKSADTVREIFNLYVTGEWSTTRLALELNERGIVDADGRKFTQSRVATILSKRAYTGEKGTKRVGKKGEAKKVVEEVRTLPAIITKELFDKCEQLRKGAKVARKHNYASAYLCNKLITCKCGYHYTASNTVYRCFKQHDEDVKHVATEDRLQHTDITLSITMMDSLVWKLAADLEVSKLLHADTKKVAEYKEQLAVASEKVETLTNELAKYATKREKVTDLVVDGMLTKEQAKAKLEKLNQAEEMQKAELGAAEADVKRLSAIIRKLESPTISYDLFSQLNENLPENIEKKRAIVRTHIANITVSDWQTMNSVELSAADMFKQVTKQKRYCTITIYDVYGYSYQYRYFPRWSFGKSRLEEMVDEVWHEIEIKKAA